MSSNATVRSSSATEPAAGESAAGTRVTAQLDGLVQAVDDALLSEGVEAVPQQAIQALMALAVKLYAARRALGEEFPPTPGPDSVNGTEAAVTTSALLQAANIDLFELSLWRHWGKP